MARKKIAQAPSIDNSQSYKKLKNEYNALRINNDKLIEEKTALNKKIDKLNKKLQKTRDHISQILDKSSQFEQENKRLVNENKLYSEKPDLEANLMNTGAEIKKLQKEHIKLNGDTVQSGQEKEDSPPESVRSYISPQQQSLLESSTTDKVELLQKSMLENSSSKPSIDCDALLPPFSKMMPEAKQPSVQPEPIKVDMARFQRLEKDLFIEKDRIRNYDRDKKKLKAELARTEQQRHGIQIRLDETQQKLDQTRQEKEQLQKDIQDGNRRIEVLNDHLAEQQGLRLKEKHLVGIEWAQELTSILTKLSSLTGLEPEPITNLTARSIYETFLDWMGKAFGKRPTPFPDRKELLSGDVINPQIFLDADQNDLQDLFKCYDWSPDRPFEGLTEGNRKRGFRILHWGWKVSDNILVKARVSPLPFETDSEFMNDGGKS